MGEDYYDGVLEENTADNIMMRGGGLHIIYFSSHYKNLLIPLSHISEHCWHRNGKSEEKKRGWEDTIWG